MREMYTSAMIPPPRHDRVLVYLLVILILCTLLTILFFVPAPSAPNHPGMQGTQVQPVPAASGSCLSPAVTTPGAGSEDLFRVKILAINDFHGQIPTDQEVDDRPVGSAPVVAAYLKNATQVYGPDRTVIAIPGDAVGASPPESGLLADEPAMLFFNEFANPCCTGNGSPDSACNMVAVPGNHEFDEGIPELLRLVYGGNGNTTITHLTDPYPGALSSYTCSNIVWKENGTTLFPPYVVRNIRGVPIAFIGADTITTPERLTPHRADEVTFLDETGAINRYVREVQRLGVHAIVVLIHEGGSQQAYDGDTRSGTNVTGRITDIVAGLDGDVDVVLSGHSHKFTNAYLPNAAGRPVLVTQAYSYGKGFADVDLTLDPVSRDIVNTSARIVVTRADRPPGTSPDPEAAALLTDAGRVVAPVVNQHIAIVAHDITADENAAGESALGDLVADADRMAMKTDVAFITTGSLRADIESGDAMWGDLYAVEPFSGTVVSMNLTGRQILSILERQWQEPLPPHNLAVSGMAYTFDGAKPAGSRVVTVSVGREPLDPSGTYTVSTMDYLATGGDGYTEFVNGTMMTTGPKDVDALASYLEALPQPVNVTADGRIRMT